MKGWEKSKLEEEEEDIVGWFKVQRREGELRV